VPSLVCAAREISLLELREEHHCYDGRIVFDVARLFEQFWDAVLSFEGATVARHP